MKIIKYFISVLIITLSFGINAQSSKKAKKNYPYLLYLPKDYKTADKEIPLVIYLHGASCKGNNLSRVKKYGLPYYVSKGNQYDFIIASPQCPSNKSWLSDNWFEPLYNMLISKYPIDKHRVYVVGMSMGGYGAWHLAMDFPNIIAAIVPLCGGCYDSTHISRIKQIPVWAFHGVLDKAIPINETEKLISKLISLDAPVKYTRVEDRGHNIANYFARKEIYDWLLEQKKESIISK